MKIFDNVLTHIGQSLDVRLVEHNVLAGNIANADTPGYRPKELVFSQAMQAAQSSVSPEKMTATQAQHMDVNGSLAGAGSGAMEAANGLVHEGAGITPSIDGNGVDVDRTMAGLAENALQYSAGAKAAQKKLGILRYVVSEGSS